MGTLNAGVPASAMDEGDEYGLLSDVSEGTEPGSSLIRLLGT
jgi:hypothetical protein